MDPNPPSIISDGNFVISSFLFIPPSLGVRAYLKWNDRGRGRGMLEARVTTEHGRELRNKCLVRLAYFFPFSKFCLLIMT